jgi:hypothetical protein
MSHPFKQRLLLVLFVVLPGLFVSLQAWAAAPQQSSEPKWRSLLPLVRASEVSNPPITITNRWSDPQTWPNQRVPAQGEIATIAAGQTVLLDVSPPALKGIQLNGTLVFDDRDLDLTVNWIMLHGRLVIGTQAQPFSKRATITFTSSDMTENVMSMGTRGLLMMGGRLEAFGITSGPTWTKLNDHANAGTNQLTLKDAVKWQSGDQIVIAPTEFFPRNANGSSNSNAITTERLTLSSVNGTSVGVSTPLQKFRWGKLQHVTDEGMSLTPDPDFTPPATPFPTVLDQRAAVGNLSRNIVFQGADDELWRTQQFGAHVMAMAGSVVQLDGVEFRRVGQVGRSGRYPIHFHLLSYDQSSGATLADASSSFVRNSAIWQSRNRCIVIHGTNGVRIQNNICYDIKGHAIFLEDAVERRNLLENNLVLLVRVASKPLQTHDTEIFQAGPSGFWLTNPDNIVRGNLAADAQGNGFWLSFPSKPLGLLKAVPMLPDRLPFGVFDDNTAHSNRAPGINLDWVTTNDAGDVTPSKYIPTSDGGEDQYDRNRIRFTLRRITTYKNNDHGFWNRVSWPNYEEWVSADNDGTFFAGAGDDGLITRSLVVGTSLNNREALLQREPSVAFASYHSTFDMARNVVVNMPFVDGQPSGVFKTDDYYITGVDKGPVRNPDNRLINSHPGYRVLPKLDENWTLAGALWDPHGYWGPKNNFWTYDNPFLTSNANCQPVAPAGKNGMSCDGQYYGVGDFLTDFDTRRYNFKAPLDVTRIDENGQEIGEWTVGDGDTAPKLGNMRNFSARTGGRYILRFPGKPIPTDVEMDITNAWRADDWFLLGVSFSGTATIDQIYLTSWRNRDLNSNFLNGQPRPNHPWVRPMSPGANLAAVLNSQGEIYWRDTANNLVWVKVRGGLPVPDEANLKPNTDAYLYRTVALMLVSK